MTSEAVFIQVGALAEGFAPESHLLAPLDTLAGERLHLFFADGSAILCRFIDGRRLSWGDAPAVSYRATSLRAGVYFVDFIHPQRQGGSITLICDINALSFTAVMGSLPDEKQTRLGAFSRVEQGKALTGVEVEMHFGTLNRPYQRDGRLHHETPELLGMRNLYTYSPTERYEHIYLNEGFYAWHCLDGVEKGLADVDRCHYIRLGERLYLFIWREKIIPTLGVVMIDLASMRTDGKILGYSNAQFAELSNFAVGAHAEILNQTRYPPPRK